MHEDEILVIDIFDYFGIKAEKIPESTEKSPDFLIQFDSKKILIELKTKYDSSDFLGKRKHELDTKGTFEHSDVLKSSNAMSKRIKTGYKQLKEKKEKENANECYLFLLASQPYAHNKFEQFYSTVYGLKFIIPVGRNAPTGKYCFYYDYSDFYRYNDIIDGAFISDGKRLRFCANTFSTSYNDLYENKFINKFASALIDPIKLEQNGEAFILDSDIDRKNTDQLNEYLKQKYNLKKIAQGNFPSFTIESRVQLDD